MIRWRNVFIAALVSAWAHGLASAIMSSLGAEALSGFCIGVSILCVFALVPLGIAANEQSDDYVAKALEEERAKVRRLSAQLAERELAEPLP